MMKIKLKVQFPRITKNSLTSRASRKHICTFHAPNEKYAMMPRCLDRKYDAPPSECTRLVLPSDNTGRLFLMFGESVCSDW